MYTPNKDFYGTDRFIVEVNDANGGTATSTITITVNKVETNPVPKDPPSKGDDKGNNKGGSNNNPDESGEIPDSGLPTDPGKPGTGNKDKTPPDKSPGHTLPIPKMVLTSTRTVMMTKSKHAS